jgi:hypothetical protein
MSCSILGLCPIVHKIKQVSVAIKNITNIFGIMPKRKKKKEMFKCHTIGQSVSSTRLDKVGHSKSVLLPRLKERK